MKTAREIIGLIGADRIKRMFKVGDKSLQRAATLNLFTSSWWRGIKDELTENGHPEPSEDLFNWKEREK